jgi:hypothetical protein
MPPSNSRSNPSFQDVMTQLKPSAAFVIMIFGALIAFEIFNYSTTDHALRDLLGDLRFAGIYWSTILAIAFCGIDFAGIARLFTPEQGMEEPKEVWYLFGAWLLAATMNAILTWWGVSMAVAGRTIESSAVINPKTITSVVPVFVAIMVWVIRILIIGTLSLAMDRLLHPGVQQRPAIQNAMAAQAQARANRMPVQTTQPMNIPASLNSSAIPQRPNMSRAASANQRTSRPATAVEEPEYISDMSRTNREPTYHSLSMSSRPPVNNNNSTDPNNRYRR